MNVNSNLYIFKYMYVKTPTKRVTCLSKSIKEIEREKIFS